MNNNHPMVILIGAALLLASITFLFFESYVAAAGLFALYKLSGLDLNPRRRTRGNEHS